MSGPSFLDRLRMRFREMLIRRVSIADGPDTYHFRCESAGDLWRARTLFEKEPGTVAWIKSDVRPGDVFYDIGANIGLYTVLAGRRVQPGGAVVSFEPHAANAHSLLHNVRENGLGGTVRVLSSALNDSEGYFDFHYHSGMSSSSQSQLHEQKDDQNQPFTPVFTELKHATTIDRLVRDGIIRPPTLVKMDVDGNEMLILRGMTETLSGAARPRAIQIEVGPRQREPILAFMAGLPYDLLQRSMTMLGQKKVDAGANPESISQNILFRVRGAGGA